MPPSDEVLHDEYIGDDSLVVTESEPTDGRKDGAPEGVVVVQETGYPWRSVCVCIARPVGMYMQKTSVRYLCAVSVWFYIISCYEDVSFAMIGLHKSFIGLESQSFGRRDHSPYAAVHMGLVRINGNPGQAAQSVPPVPDVWL